MKPLKVAKINGWFGLLLALFLIFLSFNLWKLARQSYLTDTSPVLINNSKSKNVIRLSMENQRLQSQFEFMVFEKERKQTYRELLDVLKKQINLSPFDSSLWRQLNYWQLATLSNESDLSINDKQWILSVAMRFIAWNEKERPLLLKQCVELIADQSSDVKSNCQQLFNVELQRLSVNQVKRNLNISEGLWNNVVLHYSLSLEKVDEK